jgi:TonB family protein
MRDRPPKVHVRPRRNICLERNLRRSRSVRDLQLPMPQIPLPIDPERPRPEADPAQPEKETVVQARNSGEAHSVHLAAGDPVAGDLVSSDLVSFVPHDPNGNAVAAPVRIRTNRYGELEEHEIIKLLDTIEDERARSRFRESIYISLFIWLAIAWVVFYGPRYLWHSPQLISPVDVMKERALIQLNDPRLSPNAPAPRAAPKLDSRTLSRLRSMEPKPVPRAPTPQPAVPAPPVAQPAPVAPTPQPTLPAAPAPVTPRVTTPVPEAPTPQPTSKPNFSTPGTAADSIQQAMQNSAKSRGGGGVGIRSGGDGRGAQLGNGVDILSDTQGVDFQPYLQRILRLIYEQWLPLIPEEARPPLMKQGVTQIRFTINPDGTIAAMHLDGSTHDDALNRAAWGSITSVGQFPPLPKQFHGPNLELRIHYLVNRSTE